MTLQLAAALRRAGALIRAGDPFRAARAFRTAPGKAAGEPGPDGGPTAPADWPEGGTPDPVRPAEVAPPQTQPLPEAATVHGWPALARQARPLGLTLKLLEEGRAALAGPALRRSGRAPEIPDGARFERRDFACSQGRREYNLYVPSGVQDGLRGLVVMLHGCKQDPDDFALGTRMNDWAERERLLVAYPGQGKGDNALRCWNWFNPADQRRDAGEPAILAGIARAVLAEFRLGAGRVMAAGLSAGGSMAAVLGATYPDLFRAVGIHSGLPYGAAHDAASAFAAMRGDPGGDPGVVPPCRTIVFQGEADRVVHPDAASRHIAAAGPGEILRRDGVGAGGRRYRTETLLDARGAPRLELWRVEGAGHAWSGGDPSGSYTDPEGPDASAEMVRFLLAT